MSKKKKVLIIIITIVLAIAILLKIFWGNIMDASSKSYIQGLEGNKDEYSIENVTINENQCHLDKHFVC